MPGRDVLVVIDDAATAAHLLAPAAVLARRFDARLTGFFPTGLPPAGTFGDVASGAQLVEAFMAAQHEAAVKAEAAYRGELGRLQLAGDWVVREADFGEGVTALGRLSDLVVVAQANPDLPSPRPAPEELVVEMGRPVLVVPYAGQFADFDRHVMVAWNGTREAARALYDAMFLIERADAVTVVEVDPPGDGLGPSSLGAGDVVAMLKRRGVEAVAAPTVSGGTPVADVIVSRAADLTADLVVMGAYGHSRLRELMLGGVSRSVFQEMTVPALMSH